MRLTHLSVWSHRWEFAEEEPEDAQIIADLGEVRRDYSTSVRSRKTTTRSSGTDTQPTCFSGGDGIWQLGPEKL